MRESSIEKVQVPRGLRALSYASVAAMFGVLIMGALVTRTGSAEGCGASWPLCDGQWLPANNIHSVIEYSHRLISGIAGILVASMAVWTLRRFGRRPEIRWLMGGALFLILLQSALGAMAVLWPQPDLVLALHFGISLSAFATVLLPTVLLVQMERGETHRSRRPGARLRRSVWLALVYVYGVVYSGAYVRHTNSHLACLDWPLCNDRILPAFQGAVGIQFAHRLAAAGAVLLIAWVAWCAFKERSARPDLCRGALASFALVLLQAGGGAYLVLSRLTITSMMLHSVLVTLLFASLSYLCLQSLAEPREGAVRAGAGLAYEH